MSVPHDITIVIPVADRPKHLAHCLNSLLELKQRYPYAGRVSVLVVEDSKQPENIIRQQQLVAGIQQQGLPAHHLSFADQQSVLSMLPDSLCKQLSGVFGDGQSFAHKGASISRNIACLWLSRQMNGKSAQLIWFVDSDQVFCVNKISQQGEVEEPLDYFNELDRIFTSSSVQMLTGKVVGDPPVSPAVMAGNFLADVIDFFIELRACEPRQQCIFHAARRHADDAAYHDMAELFGFHEKQGFRYQCTLSGAHDHATCLADFAAGLNYFFDGVHPTRRSFYQALPLADSLVAARTVYTGNYIFTQQCLAYFIPFADLRLRMAGPTLGRIIKAELGEQFISANLPMLHGRIVDSLGQAEFRAGIERGESRIDLADEYTRQYFGDVMLFSMEKLTAENYLTASVSVADISAVVHEVEAQLHARYSLKHKQINDKLDRLSALFCQPVNWWQQDGQLATARHHCLQFIANMQHNFGEHARGWRLINDESQRQSRRLAIVNALVEYPAQRLAWQQATEILQS